MGYLESIGGTWVWHLIALFFCLDLLFNSLPAQGIYQFTSISLALSLTSLNLLHPFNNDEKLYYNAAIYIT